MRAHRVLPLLATLSLTFAACASAPAPLWTFAPGAASTPGAPAASGGGGAATSAPSSAATPAASGSGGATGDVLGSYTVKAVDLGFAPNEFTVDKAGTYEFKLQNTGSIPHDLTFADGTKVTANPGETKTEKVNVPAEGITFLCSIPGHADAGMKGTVTVKGTSGSNAGGDHGGPAPVTDVQADPNAPPYTLYPAKAPALLPGDVHDVDLVIQEKLMTVAPGFVQAVWTFGGTVPGPVIRVKVGDTVRVHLKNPATNQLAHSIDFHASQVAWNDEMTSINPGQEKLYEWKAEYAGVWMYHCGTAPALHHIANGMYGMVIVEPKAGLPKVDNEYAIVQSEWYLGPQGQPVSLTKASAGAPAPDYVVFNGVANQYKDNPLPVKTGGRTRVFILDAGPSVDSSFHVVGTIFSSVTKEGIHLVPGNPGSWGSQAVDLSPAQGAIVEFVAPEDGLYPIVTHAFNLVGRGALGLFQAGDGDPKN